MGQGGERVTREEEIEAEQELIRQQAIQFADFSIANEISDETAQKVTPLDLLNSKNYTTRDVRDSRYEICKGCDEFAKPIKMCKECGCNMPLKTWLSQAECPLGKWAGEKEKVNG
jgi:hypothetical protein